MAGRGRARRVAWFETGANALNCLYPAIPPHYACPLCGLAFPSAALNSDLLTIEHAPPEALGGRAVCLTCRSCNSRYGVELDAHMVGCRLLVDFWNGRLSDSLRGRFTVEGQALNADVSSEGDGGRVIKAFLHEKINDPRKRAALLKSLVNRGQTNTWQDLTFKLTFSGRFAGRRALIGYLRSAYLVTFAIFGYRYIHKSDLGLVRRQIAEPQSQLLKRFYLIQDDPVTEPRIIWVLQPTWLRSLAVQVDRCLIFLPDPDEPPGFYQRRAQSSPERGALRVSVSGKLLPWPSRPQFLMDFQGH